MAFILYYKNCEYDITVLLQCYPPHGLFNTIKKRSLSHDHKQLREPPKDGNQVLIDSRPFS